MHPILGDRRRLGLYLLAWLFVGMGLALLLRIWFGMPWVAALLFGVPLGLAAAPMSLSAGTCVARCRFPGRRLPA